ncbi:15257_t:CDS:2 [Entrophospora sp. SA101]|nr:15257_t:CDS:2 [Entrophospora sp. SA101]
MLAIPRNGASNPKIFDDELIMKHLDNRFITNLGVSYNDRMQDYIGNECSDDELMERLTLHSYNDRLVEKKTDRHVQNAILFDFVESNLKGVEDYTKALQIVHDQEPMQAYLSNYAIPIVADWPAFLPIMGPLHVSLNGHELVFKENSFLFNDIYKGLFGNRKNLDDIVYSKFGRTKNIEFLYLTNLLSNLIPLVLDVYAVHH